MNGHLWAKDSRDRLPLALAVGAILIVFSWIAFAIYAPMADALDAIAATFPAEILTMVGGIGPGGYVVSQLFNVLGPLVLVAFSLTLGTSLLAGEEEDGTMALLIAHPITRGSVLAAKAATLVTMVAIAAALFWAGVTASAAYQGVALEHGGIAAACLHLFALAAAFGLLGLAAGAWSGRPPVAAAVAAAVATVAYVVATMLPVAGLDSWAALSPWFYYNGSDPLTGGVNLAHLGVLAGIGGFAILTAHVTFARRDLRG